ncbi:MAG: glucosamine-6-phosphate deaminase [Clostridia bacterium]|nr:glucosamine-6-phosphate deaminase [Clostridia bacterium]
MNFIKAESYEALSCAAAEIIAAQIAEKKNAVLGLATGSSPLGTYACLRKMYEEERADFSEITSVNLDEYVGLSAENEQSYRYFMNKNLFDHINIRPENTVVPNGCAEELAREAMEYDALIARLGGIDLQLLGIGLDGHIGFNEPAEFFTKETHVTELDASTIEANARFFARREDVPTKAITMGMGAIMGAKKILLIANGKKKREILEKAMYGKITPRVPASILQLHPNVTVIYSEI